MERWISIAIIRYLHCDDVLGESSATGGFNWTRFDGGDIITKVGELWMQDIYVWTLLDGSKPATSRSDVNIRG